MAKSPDAFRTISEVADWLDVPTHVLRFWESRFAQIKPVKRAGGRRYYRPADMELLGGIKRLLHQDGLTIRGVQKLLREEGVRRVSSLSPSVDGGEAPPGPALGGGDNVVALPPRIPDAPLDRWPFVDDPADLPTATDAPEEAEETGTVEEEPDRAAAAPDGDDAPVPRKEPQTDAPTEPQTAPQSSPQTDPRTDGPAAPLGVGLIDPQPAPTAPPVLAALLALSAPQRRHQADRMTALLDRAAHLGRAMGRSGD